MTSKHKLLITPVFKSLSKFRKLGYKKIISNNPFRYGVKVKNINNLPFNGAVINKIQMYESTGSANSDDCVLYTENEFKIPPLNPNETKIIWFENAIPSFSGETWLEMSIKNKEEIITYQWDKGNSCLSGPNKNK